MKKNYKTAKRVRGTSGSRLSLGPKLGSLHTAFDPKAKEKPMIGEACRIFKNHHQKELQIFNPQFPNLFGLRKNVYDLVNKPMGNILIKEHLHDAIPECPSLDAAKNKQALILSSFNSEKSSIISALVIPLANQLRTSKTDIRVPFMIGFPNLFSELISIYLLMFITTKLDNIRDVIKNT